MDISYRFLKNKMGITESIPGIFKELEINSFDVFLTIVGLIIVSIAIYIFRKDTESKLIIIDIILLITGLIFSGYGMHQWKQRHERKQKEQKMKFEELEIKHEIEMKKNKKELEILEQSK